MSSYSEKPSQQNDFYGYINHEWLQSNPIPSEYTKWGNFHVLHERNQERLKEMLEQNPVSEEQKKLNILWKKGLNKDELNSNAHLGIFKFDTRDLNQMIITWMTYNLAFLFDAEAYTDLKDSNRNILYLDVMGLGLPDRDYYLNEKMKDKQDLYKGFLEKFLRHFNINCDYNEIYSFEETVAKIKLAKADRRDPNKLYNLHTYDELISKYPGIPWSLLFSTFKFPTNDKIVVTEPQYFEFLSKFILDCYQNEKQMEFIKNYYAYKLAKVASPYLDDVTYGIYFDFYGRQLMGQKEPKQRWKRVLTVVDGILGEVLSKAYVQKYFSEDHKVSCKNMIQEICKTYEERIKQLDWMSDETKEKALSKLSKFNVKIGYPDKWTDFSKLEIKEELSYFENILESMKWELNHNLEKLYKPVDKLKWHMNAHDINAYYSPSMNEIVFPAGILQEPFYSINQSISENLGGIGAVIGHEMTHGFDDKGRLYDLNGNLNDWWTKEDASKFEERSKKLHDLFASYEYFGINVNGKLTLGENIADLGGLTFSLKTLERLVPEKDIKEETRKLFVQWARIWRCNITDDTLKNQLLTDPHSPTQLRVNAILPNFDEFYEIFDIKEGDKMYVKPEMRSKIW